MDQDEPNDVEHDNSDELTNRETEVDLEAAAELGLVNSAMDDSGEILPSSTAQKIVKKRVGGAMMANAMLGLRDILEPEREESPIVMEVAGDPPSDETWVDADIDYDVPEDSSVTVRPWAENDSELTHPHE